MSELPTYAEMAAEKLKERSKASGGELGSLISYSCGNLETRKDLFGVSLLFTLENVVVRNCCPSDTHIKRVAMDSFSKSGLYNLISNS